MEDIVIIGGGIVGLSTGLKIKEGNANLKVVILEKEGKIAVHQTGHNSGVIHSGLYYKPGSLKAVNCVNGYNAMIEFCKQNEVPYEICGKLVVATKEEQKPQLDALYGRGMANGLKGVVHLTAPELKDYEPNVAGIAGLFVPQTGIVDFKQVAEKIASNFQELQGDIVLKSKFLKARRHNNHINLMTASGDFETKLVINCGGLYSDKVAQEIMDEDPGVRILPFRGEYYRLSSEKEGLVKNLIYPVPDPDFPFLGVHFTRMINGGVEAGPNAVLALGREGYKKSNINLGELSESLLWPGFPKMAFKYWKMGLGEMYRSFSRNAFTRALQSLIPEIEARDLKPGGSGVRAQACSREGVLIDDFVIREDECSVHVLNAPSPAATSCLSIGETIADLALQRF